MNTEKFNPRLTILAIFMISVAAMRIPNAAQLTPWANFSPIGAMALFGGTYFTKKWIAILFPLLTLFASDIIIHAFVFGGKYGVIYSGWYLIYSIFIIITFIGRFLMRTVNTKNFIFTAIVAALTHWLLADFLVWVGGGTDLRTMQPLSLNWQGLVQCYLQGLPYMRNFLAGTIIYGGLMFGSFEWMKQRYSSLQVSNQNIVQ